MTSPIPPPSSPALLRPSVICRQLLAALDASEGRRRKRKRDTTPDATGLAIKRWLLEEAARVDPGPDQFEACLLDCVSRAGDQTDAGWLLTTPSGARLAMARSILEEWRLACASPGFRTWLATGSPSDDR